MSARTFRHLEWIAALAISMPPACAHTVADVSTGEPVDTSGDEAFVAGKVVIRDQGKPYPLIDDRNSVTIFFAPAMGGADYSYALNPNRQGYFLAAMPTGDWVIDRLEIANLGTGTASHEAVHMTSSPPLPFRVLRCRTTYIGDITIDAFLSPARPGQPAMLRSQVGIFDGFDDAVQYLRRAHPEVFLSEVVRRMAGR